MGESVYSRYLSSVERFQDRIFLKDERRALTYGQSREQVDALSQLLRRDHAVEAGTRVGIVLSNRVEYVVTALALNRIGAIFVPISTAMTPGEMSQAVRGIAIAKLVYESAYESLISECSVDKLEVESLAAASAALAGPFAPPTPRDDAAIFLTSGTTGGSKGALLGTRSFFNCAHIISSGSGYSEKMTSLVAAPIYHVYPFLNQIGPGIFLGHTLVLENYSSIHKLLTRLADERVELFLAAPTLFTLISLVDDEEREPLPHAKIFSYSGAPMSAEVVKSLAAAYPGVALVNSYGLTEAGGTITVLPSKHALQKPDSVGIPGPGVDIKLIDERLNFIERGIGEIAVKTVAMKGYVNADASLAFHEGYLRTGDLGEFDAEGYLFLRGRVDDMMIIHGINVYPSDVEQLLRQCSVVLDCAVKSSKSVFGEHIVAYLVSDGNVPDAKRRIDGHIKLHLPRHKQPAECVYVDAIPYSRTGKVLKRLLGTK
jgi:long-chain acyl-CoA synthetase